MQKVYHAVIPFPPSPLYVYFIALNDHDPMNIIRSSFEVAGHAYGSGEATQSLPIHHPDIAQVTSQFLNYLSDPMGHVWKLDFCGQPQSPFQQRLLQTLQQIPMGQTVSYGELAKHLHSSPRAVGQACKRNPYVVAVPCHRVLAQGRGLGGYCGKQQSVIKKWLLTHEGVEIPRT